MTATRLVVALVGASLLLSTALIGLLAAQGQAVPDVLQNIAVGSLTGLVGLLVRPDSSSSSTSDVD